jgi:NADPH:quinone reductase-like Zn-dependent oxidoreductase
VKTYAVGDRVFGYDDTAFGAHAQYLSIREDALVVVGTCRQTSVPIDLYGRLSPYR